MKKSVIIAIISVVIVIITIVAIVGVIFINLNKEKTSIETNVELKNYSKYTLLSSGKYMVVSRINNTVIYVNADANYKDNIKNILDELGY